jgi:hypothetical protein
MKKTQLALSMIAAISLSGQANAASYFTDETAFNTAAAGFGARTVESFEGAPSSATNTSLTFGNVTFSCNGTTWCPGFFGQSTLLKTLGDQSVFGATPDTMTFTFTSAINVFAVDTIGLADVGVTNFSVLLSNGNSNVMYSNLAQPGGTVNFIGVIDTTGFTSVTFSGTAPNDGVFYDRLQFTAAVPEPETYAIMLAGLGLIGFTATRRKQTLA